MRRVLVLNTGGTIGMQDTPHGFACGPPGFLTDICRSVPMIHDSAFAKQLSTTSQPAAEQEFEDHMMVTPLGEFGTRTSFQIIDYDPLLDSSNMTHVDWVRIASDIDARYSKWDAFVVLHGTDTMAFTCSALSFMLQNLGKTVVVTGSQIPLSRSRSDGISNFLGALLIAGTFNIPEVTLYFADELYRGNRASKVDASGLHAFKSPNMSPLATLGVTCSVRWDLVRPASPGRLRLKPEFETNLVIIRVFPGPFTTLRNTLRPPLRGAILQTFGAGNAPDRDPDFLQALREASDRGVVIVNVTQCSSGTVEPHYATGQSLETAGVIPGGDMTPEAALVKLGWLLGCGLDGEQVRKMMRTDLCGELTDRRTQRFSLGDGGFLRAVFSAIHEREPAWGDAIQPIGGSNTGLVALRRALMPTLLCAAAGIGDKESIISMINDGGVHILRTARDYDGRTPLHLAASEGRLGVITYLLQPEHALDLCPLDRNDNTPLANACKFRHREVVKLLVNAGARLTLSDLRLAGIMCSLVKSSDKDGLACYIAARANVCVADHSSTTPLHVAAALGDAHIASMLLTAGADPSAMDRWGRTPWHEATTRSNPNGQAQPHEGHIEVAAILRKHVDISVAKAMGARQGA